MNEVLTAISSNIATIHG